MKQLVHRGCHFITIVKHFKDSHFLKVKFKYKGIVRGTQQFGFYKRGTVFERGLGPLAV